MTMLKQKFTERKNFATDCEPFLNSNIKKNYRNLHFAYMQTHTIDKQIHTQTYPRLAP